jgi:hypothetical protein
MGVQLYCSCDDDHARLLTLREVDRTSSWQLERRLSRRALEAL